MVSKIRQFQFRSPQVRKSLEAKKINPDRFAQAALEHIAEQMETGICPVCKKSFDDCDYFQSLEDEE